MTASAIIKSIFSALAVPLLRQGYSPIPVKGKQPAINEWQLHGLNRPAEPTLNKWARQFPNHSVGAACGHLVALDIDDETEDGAEVLQRRAFQRFGETPLIRIGRAPRRVLLYRAPEPFRSIKEKEAQVLGVGTQVVLFGLHPTTERPYTWPNATPLDVPLKDLPPISEAGARDWLGRPVAKPRRVKTPLVERESAFAVAPADHEGVREGNRNAFIFYEARAQALSAASLDDLKSWLLASNQLVCRPPLPAEEVRRVAQSVWKYREGGHLFERGGEAHTVVHAAEFDRLADEPDAIALLVLLRLRHGARSEPFAIVKEAMSRVRLIANWSGKVYAHSRDVLLDRGFLDLMHEGGGRGNPHLYALNKPSPLGTQYNPTLSSFSSACLGDERNARDLGREGPTFGLAAISGPAPSLFNGDALPPLPTPQEQLRAVTRGFLANQPRGTQSRLAAEFGCFCLPLRELEGRPGGIEPECRREATCAGRRRGSAKWNHTDQSDAPKSGPSTMKMRAASHLERGSAQYFPAECQHARPRVSLEERAQ